MGIGTGIAVMARGAVLAFAVDVDTGWLDLQATGVVLMLTGLLLLALSVLYWNAWWGGWTPSSTHDERRDRDRRY